MDTNPILKCLQDRLAQEDGRSVPMRLYVLNAEGKLMMLRDTGNNRWDVKNGLICFYDPDYDTEEPKEVWDPSRVMAVDFGQFGLEGEKLKRSAIPLH